MRPGDLIEVRETWCTCQPKTTDRIVRVGRIDSVTAQSVTVDREVSDILVPLLSGYTTSVEP